MSKKIITNNKKARHDFFIEDSYEAGIVLTGTEIKSVRLGHVSLKESFAKVKDGEVFLYGMNINPFEQGNIHNVDPIRPRKLLLNKREIRKIEKIVALEGLALIPLNLYLNEKGLAKIELGIAKGKKKYDKRESIAKRDADRRMKKSIKNYNN